MTFYDRFRWAQDLFEHRDYLATARVLEQLLGDLEDAVEPVRHGLADARELLARAYFHTAQLGRAEVAARALLADDPTNSYAALLLTRVLRRGSRHQEADHAAAHAAALGASTTDIGSDTPSDIGTELEVTA